MSKNVIQLSPKVFCLNKELDEFDLELSKITSNSFERYHLLSLLVTILESDNTHEHCKTKVIQLLLKHSITLPAMLRYGSKEISEILYEAEAKVRNIG